MSAKHLILGFDGADLDVVRALGKDKLPNLFAAMERGGYARLESVQPPATLPNWTTFLTGTCPAVHGVFDFTTRKGYRVNFTGGAARERSTFIARLDKLGRTCACIGFPATYPPERLSRGVFISGWDAPVAFSADASFVWPPELHDELTSRFGPMRFDDVDEFEADKPGWIDALPAALEARIADKTQVAKWLLSEREFDVFALYFGESDTASHYLWARHDASSPRREADLHASKGDGLARIYMALDKALGELLEAAAGSSSGREVELTILSDHGSGGTSDKVLYLNRLLSELGHLHFKSGQASKLGLGRAASKARELALRLLPGRVRERLFEIGGGVLPSLLESRLRFGDIDMSKTRCFSDELNYFPAIHLNLQGREPGGVLDPKERDRFIAELSRELLAIRDPWDGSPVIKEVHKREDLFEGPYLERAPDLLLTLHHDQRAGSEYTYNLMPSSGAPKGTGAFRQLAGAELTARKGRSLAGSHRSHGLFVAAGPRVGAVGEVEAHIADVTATLLARMDVEVPEDARGFVRWELLEGAFGGATDALPEREREANERRGEDVLYRRLKQLGYVD